MEEKWVKETAKKLLFSQEKYSKMEKNEARNC